MRRAGILLVMIGFPFLSLGTVYEVGEGRPYASIGAVPWESLQAGDTVLIYWRATPYKEKWVIARQGTFAAPIIVRGVPGPRASFRLSMATGPARGWRWISGARAAG